MEHMKRIAEKLNKLREQDKKFRIFGSDEHKYELNPVLTQAEIKAYEEKNNLTLPEDYRWFLLNIGNGGAGPHYGMYELFDPKYTEEYPFVYGQMFSIVENEEEADYDSDEDEPLYFIREHIVHRKSQQSTIEICNEGCGMEIMLVLKGKEKGNIWFTDFGNESGLFSIESEEKPGTSMTFAEWYETWLDASLKGEDFDAESFINEEDLTQIEVTEEDIEKYKAGEFDEEDEDDDDDDDEDEDEAPQKGKKEKTLNKLSDIEGYIPKYVDKAHATMSWGASKEYKDGKAIYEEAIQRADFDRLYLQYRYIDDLCTISDNLKGKEREECRDIIIAECRKGLAMIPNVCTNPIFKDTYEALYRRAGNGLAWYSYEKKENLEEALAAAELAVAHINGDSSFYWIFDTLARVLLALGRKEEAYPIINYEPAYWDFSDIRKTKDFQEWKKANPNVVHTPRNGRETTTEKKAKEEKPTKEKSATSAIISSNNKHFIDTHIGNAWDSVLKSEFEADYFKKLQTFLEEEYSNKTIYPAKENIFNTLKFTAPDKVRVVILGQDPYINEGQAHGFALSVLPGVPPPPSLKNMYKELETDLGIPVSKSGHLIKWAEQGVLLLNTVLTVEAGKSNSHAKKGWEKFTDAVFAYLGASNQPIVFMLWGKPAQAKEKFITGKSHCIIKSPHPSPLSASTGFFGSKPYSKANAFLKEKGLPEIDWEIS